MKGCILASDSNFIYPAGFDMKKDKYGDLRTTGDASENGLLKFWQPLKRIEEVRAEHVIAKDSEGNELKMPFNSTNKYAFSIRNV